MRVISKKKVVISSLIVLVMLAFIATTIALHFVNSNKFQLVASPTGLSTFSRKERGVSQGDYYVAVDGSDENNGSLQFPFATIQKAQDVVRGRILEGLPSGGLTVSIKGGEYSVDNLSFDERDSGAIDRPIKYVAYNKEKVTLNGGVSLKKDDFTAVSDSQKQRLSSSAKDKVVAVDLAKYGIEQEDYGKLYALGAFNTADKYTGDTTGANQTELFFNNERMTLARYPNEDNLKVGKVTDLGDCYEPSPQDYREEWLTMENPRGGTFKIDSKTNKRIKNWKSRDDIWIFGYFYWDWADMSTPVKKFNTDKSSLTTEFCSRYGFRKDAPYYFYNVFEELDAEGEWYLDRETGILYIYPPSDMNNANINLSITTKPIINAVNVKYMTFEGLNVEGTRDSGINLNGDNCKIIDCYIANTAENGINVKGNNNVISSSEITKVGKNGIVVDGGSRVDLTLSNNVVDNNYVHHYAELQKTYASGIRVQGVGNKISHNEISNAPHMAIFYEGNEHIIEYNNIYEVVLYSSDAGAIYAGRNLSYYGNIIRYNCIYNIGSKGFAPNGIYFDDGLAGQTAYSNLLVNIPQFGILVGGGRDNNIYNNMVINAKTPLYFDDRLYDGFNNGGWYKKHVNSKDALHWKLLAEAKELNQQWGNKYVGIDVAHANFNNSSDENFAVNPTGSRMVNNIVATKNKAKPIYAPGVLKYGKIENNGVFKYREVAFVDFANGNYNITEEFGAKNNFEPIPLSKIGRY